MGYSFKICLTLLFVSFFAFTFATTAKACTYEASISGNHIDFTITSDTEKLAVVQYLRRSGSALVTKMYGPEIGSPWTYFDDPLCNVYVNYPVGCRQIRWQVLGEGAFWQWSNNGYVPYHNLPGGVWGLDFDSPPTYDSIGVEYGIQPGTSGEAWTLCNRTGDVQPQTPSPTPTPFPTPVPVNKVYFIPGMGTSWNADAFANCTHDNNPENWTLAPYAESYYSSILSALSNTSWEVRNFYYDWRQQVPINASSLSETIMSNTLDNEKVNIVGHSMGGLLAKDYLESKDGYKINSLLTLGSPHEGSALAYAPWAGGDVWNDNFLTKIAITLYLKHCGGILSESRETIQTEVPSIQNLLPTKPYLRKIKSETNYMPIYNVNNWYSPYVNPWGVKLGTIAGTGFDTLGTIQTKEAKDKDLVKGNWLDGKPAGKFYSLDGDGTVLTSSALIPNADYVKTINQTHAGLVSSIEGITEILNFLETPTTISETPSPEPTYVLVVIGYPASFVITDQHGNVKQDKNGMISFNNPENGKYKVSMIPKNKDTLFVVGQFFANGKTKYKEYHIQGFGPKFGTLDFNLDNPSEDIFK